MRKLLAIFFLFACSLAHGATIVASAGGGTWTNTACWVGAVVPTAADDAQLTVASGNVTIDAAGAVCRSLDCNTYTGILAHNASSTLTIGDGTAGAGNIALRLVAGMTYTLGSATSSQISFISTSATQQTVDTAGKTCANVVFNAASNGSWIFTGNFVQGVAPALTLTKGTLNFGTSLTHTLWGFDASAGGTKTIALGTGSIIGVAGNSAANWNVTASGTTMSAHTSVVWLSGDAGVGNGNNFVGGSGLTYHHVLFTGGGALMRVSSGTIFGTLCITGRMVKTDLAILLGNITITNRFMLQGRDITNRLAFVGTTVGAQNTITTGAAVTNIFNNVDIRDINLSVAADVSANSVGNLLGNNNITFTPMVTNYCLASGSFLWSSNAVWSTRVPLAQDDVYITNAFTGGSTITWDQPVAAGRNVSFAGSSGSPAWIAGSTVYGNLNTTGIGSHTSGGIGLAGRSAQTWTTGGLSYNGAVSMTAPSGTYTLQDNLSGTAASFTMTVNNGTFDHNGMNVTCRSYGFSGIATKTINLGTGTLTLNSATGETIWNPGLTGTTFSGLSSSIVISDTGSATKTFAGLGMKYGNLSITGGGTGPINFSGVSNSWNNFTIGYPKNVNFTSGTTNNFVAFTARGISGSRIAISSVTNASHYLSKLTGSVSGEYLSLTNSSAIGGATWYAGANSLNLGNNTGWIFSADPSYSDGATGVQNVETTLRNRSTSAQQISADQRAKTNPSILPPQK